MDLIDHFNNERKEDTGMELVYDSISNTNDVTILKTNVIAHGCGSILKEDTLLLEKKETPKEKKEKDFVKLEEDELNILDKVVSIHLMECFLNFEANNVDVSTMENGFGWQAYNNNNENIKKETNKKNTIRKKMFI